MKLHGDITINGKTHAKGSNVPWTMIYPFFMLHMLMFGASGFFMAYGAKDVSVFFLYAHGGFAIFVYAMFYLATFGRDEVKWMFINAGLGLLGIYTQVDWLLSLFGKKIGDYPWYVNVIPFLYFILYTFLIRHAFMDIMGGREDAGRRKRVDITYIVVSVLISLIFSLLAR
jgi:hypothetical protein